MCICEYDCMLTLEIKPEINWKYILLCKLFGLYNMMPVGWMDVWMDGCMDV